jgi:hypothetical protein
MDRDDFFRGIHEEANPAADDIARLRQLAYEESVIKRVINHCGVNFSSWGQLARLCRDATDEKKLHFDWFNQHYGRSFPATLAGGRIPYMHNITLPDLFKPVAKNKLIRKLSKAFNACGIDPLKDRYLFVFPLVRTKFCVHTLSNLELPPLEQNFQICLNLSAAKRPIVIEPLKNACAAIGDEWFAV